MRDPVRREIHTCSPSKSIWQPPVTEEAFRAIAVDLALATNECPIEADVGIGSPSEEPAFRSIPGRTLNENTHKSRYVLPFVIEHRLANDFALIAATQEAVFSVTAGGIEEHLGRNGHLETLVLRLAANEGISENLKASLQDIWESIKACSSSSTESSMDNVFEKIVHLNRTRILQRVRKAVGHPPIFREKGRTRTNPDDKLLRAFARMRKEKLTPVGQEFVYRATVLNTDLLHLLDTVSIDNAERASGRVLSKLCEISKRCFDVTTIYDDELRVPFKHLLKAAGLDQRTWLKNKHVAEIDKIGSYWRIAQSLVHVYQRLTAIRPSSMAPIRLIVEGIQPYVSVMQGPSIQGRDMACYVHAEVQLLAHYLVQDSQQQLTVLPPRVIGASKSACFLCFLFITCHGALRPPATHGRLYDQWTIPDLEEYTADHVNDLRSTVGLMKDTMLGLRAAYSLRKPRDFPMTSRTDLDRLSILTAKTTSDSIHEDGHRNEDFSRQDHECLKPGEQLRQAANGSSPPCSRISNDVCERQDNQTDSKRPPTPVMGSKRRPGEDGMISSHAPCCLKVLWSRLYRRIHAESEKT